MEDPTFDHGRVNSTSIQKRRHHCRRRGLTVGPGHRDGAPGPGDLGQRLGPPQDRNGSFVRLDQFGIARRDGGRVGHEVGFADVRRIVTDCDLDAPAPEPVDDLRRVQVRSGDGVTDLYGVMYKPFDFDSTKVYPVIEYVYPGPQTEAVAKSFNQGNNLASRFEIGLAQLGFSLGPEPSPVVAVRMTSREQALANWQQLLDNGVYINLILPPAAPDGTALLRCSVSAAHTPEQIDRIIEAFRQLPRDPGQRA